MDIAPYADRLLRLRNELRERLEAISHHVRNQTNPVSVDSAEQSGERENDEVVDAIGNATRAELQQVGHALARLEAGEYFDCERCGGPILPARLQAVPYAALCLSCAEETELESQES